MYLPRHFSEDDPAALAALMAAHPLATLVHQGPQGLTADHVPLWHDAAGGRLLGHVARANPAWQQADGQPVLAVFRGEQAYVSPNWYPSKAEHHKVVPTWNYAVVHVHGRLRAVSDAAWLRRLVGLLTDRHEAGQPQPWSVDDAPAAFIEQMLAAIVGIEITIERLEGKFKLSQNRSTADRHGVADGLGDHPLAAQVRPG